MKLQFTGAAVTIDAAENQEPRISGIAVPYGVDASVSTGQTVRLTEGALPTDGRMPRLVLEHDTSRVVGVVDQREDTPEGMLFSARIADTAEGRDLIALLKMGALDSVSIGIQATDYEQDGRTMVIKSALWDELSVVYQPAFAGAQITEIAASNLDADETPTPDIPEEESMSNENPAVEASAETLPTTPIYAQARRQFKLPSAAEYIVAMTRGGSDFQQLNENIRAAAGDDTTLDNPGLLPTSVVAPIYDDINPIRPLVSALGTRSMPGAGKIFIRPKISVHTEVGEQSTELTGLATRTMEIDDVQVTKRTYGGTVLLSEQILDWSEPSMLEAVLSDLAGQYALATEADAVATMAANISGSNREVTDLTDPVAVIEDIYAIAALISSVGNYLPTHLICSPSVWAKLGSLKGTNDMPIFPQTAPINGIGTLPGGAGAWNGNPLGLQLVVSNQITTQSIQGNDAKDYLFVANARFMECYEQQKGAVSVEVPSSLGRQLSFRGYFSSVIMEENACWALGPAV